MRGWTASTHGGRRFRQGAPAAFAAVERRPSACSGGFRTERLRGNISLRCCSGGGVTQ